MFCSLCGFSVAWFRSLWSYTVCDCFFSFRNLRGRKRNLSPIILWEERSCRMTGYLTNFVRCDSFPFIQWFWARTEEKVSRLIGTHQLIHLNYYPYIARLKNISLLITLILELLKRKLKYCRLLALHQCEFIRLLLFSAQAAHEMVPPDCLEPVLKAIINNFVTERNSSEVMAVGLNAVRELCARYCRVFVQIFPTPSDCQVSSCDDWRFSEGSSRVWDVCTRTKPWWLIALSFTATWNSFHIDKFDAGERCDWGREQSICSTSWQRSVGEGNCRKCCQGALCQGGLRVWRHRQCYLVLLMMYIW